VFVGGDDVRTDLTLLDNHQLLLELGRERARAERRGCPTVELDRARVPADHGTGCTCHRLLAIEAEIERRLGEAPSRRTPSGVGPALS